MKSQLEQSPAFAPARAFVVQFGREPDLDSGRMAGRVEHVVSGKAARFQSVDELMPFMTEVLREVASTAHAWQVTRMKATEMTRIWLHRTSQSTFVHHKHRRRNNMDIGWKSRTFIALVLLSIFWSAYQGQTNVALAAQGSTNGAAGQMPAYYDGELFTINLLELSHTASASIIGKNPSVNTIYASNDLDEEQDFIPVISAIQGDGFNPLWQQVLIVFNAGFTPHQFFSDEEIEAAAAGANPEITLVETDEVYRCSVVGRK